MIDNVPELWKIVGILLLPGGWAAMAVKIALNGTAARIKQIQADASARHTTIRAMEAEAYVWRVAMRADFAAHTADEVLQFREIQRALGRIEGWRESV